MGQNEQPTDVAATQRITLINTFTVPPDEASRFLQRWKDDARLLVGEPGLVAARMYQAVADDAEFRFVNVAEWQSQEALARATSKPEWRESRQRYVGDADARVTARPAIYRLAVEVRPGGKL